MSDKKNELENWKNDDRTAKGLFVTAILTGISFLFKSLYDSKNQRNIDIEIARCDDTIQELQSKWFKSSEEKQALENAQTRRNELIKQRK